MELTLTGLRADTLRPPLKWAGGKRWLVPHLYGREEADAFPVVYRANTQRTIDALSHGAGLRLDTLQQIHDPTYFAFHPLLFRLNVALVRVLPRFMAEHLVGLCVKDSE